MFSKRRIAQLSFFFLRRSFFVGGFCSGVCVKRRAANTAAPTTRMRWTGQIFWLLASSLFPPSPPKFFRGLAQWEVVSSYSSATAPDFHGISCADPLFQARKELNREVAARARGRKTYLPLSDKPPTQWRDRTVRCQVFLLCGKGLKDRVAFGRSDRVGDVPKIIRCVLSNDVAQHLFKLRVNFDGFVQFFLVIFSPRVQRLHFW